MKLCSLKLKNLNSFRNTVELDFEKSPLDAASLVAITGPTGSGKTTLLDAICVALYGKTPRLSGNKNQHPRHLVSHGEKEAFAEVVFEANGTRYHANWSMRRNGSPKAELRDGNGQLITDDVAREVESILGLDFAAFRRSVLLAQGEFTAFLKAKPEDRRTILEATAGIAIYDALRDALNKKMAQVKEAHAAVLGKLDKIPEASPEQLETAEAELRSIISRIDALRATRENVQAEKETETTRKEDFEAWQAWKKRHGELLEEQTAIECLEEELTLARLAATLRPEREQFDKTTSALEKTEQELCTAKTKRETAVSIYRAACTQMVSFLEQKIQECSEIQKALFSEMENKEMELDQLSAERDTVLLQSRTFEEWDVQRKRAVKAQPIVQKYETTRAAMVDSVKRRAELMKSTMAFDKQLEQLDVDMETQLAVYDQAQADVQRWEAEQQDALQAQPINQLRQHLHAGEPCKVCGGTEHPYAARIEDETLLQSVNDALAAARERLQNAQKRLQDLDGQRERTEEKKGNINNEIKTFTTDIERFAEECASQLYQCRSVYPNLEFKESVGISSEWIADQIAEADQVIDAIRGADKKIAALRDLLGETTKRHGDCQGTLDLMRESLTDVQQQEEEVKGEPQSLYQELRETSDDEITAQQLRQYRDRWTAAAEAYGGYKKQSAERTDEYQEARKAYYEALTNTEFVSPQAHADAFRDETWVQEMSEDIDAYRRELDDLEDKISTLSEQFSEKPFQPETLPKIEAQLDNLNEKLDIKQGKRGEQEKIIKDLKENLEKRNALGTKERDAQRELERWQNLEETIPRNELRDFALEIMFKQMVHVANAQLNDLTSERYRLKVEGIGDLKVIDRWNANQERPVETLSGGESFLTSLALALALSEISRGRAQLNTLFLDEGFGTLDIETLEVAIAALEGLRLQGRSVFVISHVQELTRRIPVKISVKKRGDGRSTIEPLEK